MYYIHYVITGFTNGSTFNFDLDIINFIGNIYKKIAYKYID